MNKFNFIVFCIIGVFNSFVYSCKTPNSGAEGSCMKLRNCGSLKETLQRRFNLNSNYDWQNTQRPPEMSSFLQKYSDLCEHNKVIDFIVTN